MSDFKKFDTGKTEWDMLPWEAVEQVVKVMQFGAAKYGRDNWRSCDQPSRYLNAALRHIICVVKGETHDAESGYHHFAHAACNCLFYLAIFMANKKV